MVLEALGCLVEGGLWIVEFLVRGLVSIDFVLGALALLAVMLFFGAMILPATRPQDVDGFGIVAGIALVPFALVAFAAGQSMRARDRGRWLLQMVTIALVLVAAVIVVLAGSSARTVLS
jgi:hypothetical protein